MQSILLLVAPALFAASIYIILGRIILLVDGERHSPIRQSRLTLTFVLGDVLSFMTQAAGGITAVQVAAGAIVIAAASNNGVKGIYAYALSSKDSRTASLAALLGLALLGLLPLLVI